MSRGIRTKSILGWQLQINDGNKCKKNLPEFWFEPYLDIVKNLNIGSQFQSLELVHTCLKLNEVDIFDQSPQLQINAVPTAMLLKMNFIFYWNAPVIKMKS